MYNKYAATNDSFIKFSYFLNFSHLTKVYRENCGLFILFLFIIFSDFFLMCNHTKKTWHTTKNCYLIFIGYYNKHGEAIPPPFCPPPSKKKKRKLPPLQNEKKKIAIVQ